MRWGHEALKPDDYDFFFFFSSCFFLFLFWFFSTYAFFVWLGYTFTDGSVKSTMTSMNVPKPMMSLAVQPVSKDPEGQVSGLLKCAYMCACCIC